MQRPQARQGCSLKLNRATRCRANTSPCLKSLKPRQFKRSQDPVSSQGEGFLAFSCHLKILSCIIIPDHLFPERSLKTSLVQAMSHEKRPGHEQIPPSECLRHKFHYKKKRQQGPCTPNMQELIFPQLMPVLFIAPLGPSCVARRKISSIRTNQCRVI